MRRRSVVALIAGAVLATGPAGLAHRSDLAQFRGAFAWQGGFAGFGGYSAIELAPDGTTFSALSDRGLLTTGRLIRDAEGRLREVEVDLSRQLSPPDPVPPPEFRMDSEGLAILPDGTIFVSLEWEARIVGYYAGGAEPITLPRPPEFASLAPNEGLEALAADNAGWLYALPEKYGGPAAPVFRFDGSVWTVPFHILTDGNFVPVGADIGPDGRLYVLERSFRGSGGFASRVRRFDLHSRGTIGGETALATPQGWFGNLEGIAVWRDAAGELRLTLISDDNFLSVLGTEIVEFGVAD